MKHKKRQLDKTSYISIFIVILLLCGFLLGLILSKYIEISDTENMSNYLSVLLDKNNQKNYFISQFMLGSFSLFIITLFGMSICGIPMISFLIFTKGVQIGFSCILFILTYSYKGILGILMVFLPQIFLDLLSFYIISHFSILFSMNLIYGCTSKQIIPFKTRINKLLNILILCLILTITSSYFKSTIGIWLIHIFEKI